MGPPRFEISAPQGPEGPPGASKALRKPSGSCPRALRSLPSASGNLPRSPPGASRVPSGSPPGALANLRELSGSLWDGNSLGALREPSRPSVTPHPTHPSTHPTHQPTTRTHLTQPPPHPSRFLRALWPFAVGLGLCWFVPMSLKLSRQVAQARRLWQLESHRLESPRNLNEGTVGLLPRMQSKWFLKR